MNDDLNVVVTLYSHGTIRRCAINIPHGLNLFHDWEYFGESEIAAKWKEMLPSHVTGEIVEIQEIFEVHKV